MIVDTSVWVGLLRDQSSPPIDQLRRKLKSQESVAILPVILQELLQGARSVEHLRVLEFRFAAFPVESLADQTGTARAAAELYARCRWAGFTPRRSNDCLIAASCVQLELPLLHNDRDFLAIARIEPAFKVFPAAAS